MAIPELPAALQGWWRKSWSECVTQICAPANSLWWDAMLAKYPHSVWDARLEAEYPPLPPILEGWPDMSEEGLAIVIDGLRGTSWFGAMRKKYPWWLPGSRDHLVLTEEYLLAPTASSSAPCVHPPLALYRHSYTEIGCYSCSKVWSDAR